MKLGKALAKGIAEEQPAGRGERPELSRRPELPEAGVAEGGEAAGATRAVAADGEASAVEEVPVVR